MEHITRDGVVEAWTVAAGGYPELPADMPDEVRHAASALLAMAELGLMDRFDGAQEHRLRTIGADPKVGHGLIPVGRNVQVDGEWMFDSTEREDFLRLVFGMRRRVSDDLGLDFRVLPRSRSTLPGHEDLPPQATATRFIAWAQRQQGLTLDVVSGSFAGLDVLDWDFTTLQAADGLLADEDTRFTLRFKDGPLIGFVLPPGREDPFEAGQCTHPNGCTQTCAMYGSDLCQYRIGCGHLLRVADGASDHRRIAQMSPAELARQGYAVVDGHRLRTTEPYTGRPDHRVLTATTSR